MLRRSKSSSHQAVPTDEKDITELKEIPTGNSPASVASSSSFSIEINDHESDVQQFNDYYDDSSDEEDIDSRLSKYDINASWTQKSNQAIQSSNKNTINNDELISFVAHAAGIRLLYSKKVNAEYYPFKKTHLKNKIINHSATDQLKNIIIASINKSVEKAIEKAYRFLTLSEQKKAIIDKFTETKLIIQTEFNDEVNKFVKRNMPLWMICLKSIKFFSATNMPEDFDRLCNEITKIFHEKIKIQYPQSDDSARAVIKQEIFQLAVEEINLITQKLDFNRRENLTGKLEAIKALENYKSDYKQLVQCMKELIVKIPARGYVSNMLQKKLEEKNYQDICMNAYLEDLITLMHNKSQSKKLTPPVKNLFKKYYLFTETNLSDELMTAFTHVLNQSLLESLKHIYRPTLGNNHLFASQNPYQFYANIRLGNRSQQRQTKNLSTSFLGGKNIACGWRLSSTFHEDTDVIETQEILSTSLGRRDMVLNLGNYAKVNETLTQIGSYFEKNNRDVDDVKIAEWIRLIFNGTEPDFESFASDKIQLLQKLQSITFLLLGCEATRNPAMHVVNQMLLDLVIDKEWDFNDAFIGKTIKGQVYMMPMAPEGAVATSRALEANFRKFMPYPYYYRGIEDKEGIESKFRMTDLVKLEAKIVRDWIKLKSPESIRNSGKNLPQLLLDLIESHSKHWIVPIKIHNEDESLSDEIAKLKI